VILDDAWGIDEAGRAAIAGPLVIAAYHPCEHIGGVKDSKKLTEKQREALYPRLLESGVAKIKVIPVRKIDKYGIVTAEMWEIGFMLDEQIYHEVVVDGPRYKVWDEIEQNVMGVQFLGDDLRFEVDADDKYYSVAAASIIAKVFRDHLMKLWHEIYPEYNWASNKGYPTPEHCCAVREHGLTPLHRKTFVERIVSGRG